MGFLWDTDCFQVTGVSHGRQAAVRTLQAGDAVMIVPEPENPESRRGTALAVKKLDGTMLGYVPGSLTGDAPYKGQFRFGKVESRGPAFYRPEMWGFRVMFEAQKPGLQVIAAPRKLEGIIYNLGAACPEKGGRCQITGVKCEVLSAVADWYEDTNNHTFVLKGFIYMDPKLKIARDGILADQPSPKWIQRLQNANKWTDGEVQDYIGYLQDLQDQREDEDWDTDVSLYQKIKNEP